ncbi:MAG: LytTR family DNA-binding domain-containing protein [Dysgonamonadaceae bacterium]|nr:LytTR family DNA-binding domain-containing protein [Dysgonamonadaceae bacterium]
MNVLIIEDEIVAAQALQTLILEINPEIRILAVLQSIDESLEWLQLNPQPDLLFVDIHLADGSAFTLFEKTTVSCPIIFTTAYDEYALKAFEVNSIDYLLKPINKKALERAIRKFEHFNFHSSDNIDLINKLLTDIKRHAVNYKTYFLVPLKDKLIPLAVSDIAYIYIDTKMIKAVSFSGPTYYLDLTLDTLMLQLNPDLFFRANRQYIIAHKAIKDISLWFGSKISVNLILPTPERIIISKARVGEFKRWFAK